MSSITDLASKSLGSANSYAVYTDKFDASQLNFMPRALARSDWGITGEEFDGFDVWHCYEATFLLDSGQPVAGTLKVVFPVSNELMVESKSFKLYLNTFDMCRMGDNFKDAIRNYEAQIVADMKAGGLKCEVRFFSALQLGVALRGNEPHPFHNARFLTVPADVVFDDFSGQGTYPARKSGSTATSLVYTNVLRSRCRHTKQKDSGSAFVSLIGTLDPVAILKTIVSLREVNEFHEFCAEKLYVELSKSYGTGLGIFLLYSRRGSLDIHPVRYAKGLPETHSTRRLATRIGDVKQLHANVLGQ